MDRRAVVTTPNATWMPEFPVATPGRICTRVDGRWGPQEYSVWPQLYHSNVVHHACIPAKGTTFLGLSFDYNVIYDPVPDSEWEHDLACGVPDLGRLQPQFLALLKADARGVMERFQRVGGGMIEDQKKFGYHLCATISQALDRLTLLPTWRTHAIAIAAHVSRLCLELLGLIVLFEVVQPRVRNLSRPAKEALPLRGAFTHNPATAQGLFRLGIPVWFIQPLTKLVRVREVYSYPDAISSKMSDELSYPRLYSGEGDLSGIVHHPGDWPFKMQQEVLQTLLDAELPSMPSEGDEPASASSDARPTKKARLDADDGRKSVQAMTSSTRRSSRPAHRGHRAQAVAVEPHPSLRYKRLMDCPVPLMWADALSAVGTLPPPKSSSTYYWPPPFVFEGPGDKINRYFRNYVRIRHFLRQRLLDPTINAEPLRVAEWRDALWGEYKVQAEEPSKSDPAPRNKERRQLHQNIRRLFSATAGLPSYDASQTGEWGSTTVMAENVTHSGLRAQILWEIHEVNWRCELRELDSVLTGSRAWGTLQRWERESAVCRVWSVEGSGLRVIPLWEQDGKSCASWVSPPHSQWAVARVTFRELLRVMARWPGLPDELKVSPPEAIIEYQAEDYKRLQQSVLAFYVRSFVNVFHRLPVSPAVFPDNWL
ncbi:uncharacterized protein B0H18DRAFT_887962 [Fomitopsis serialis]|uniref:uncharacterized protein n=1 Tax=Fomitopsis serialis TaxID=139415 RepID=UPI002007441B|nr:uncharacterized protein B0H18DRAFT_887962 [Neoantrodia serialis]KAH9913612.1 hypothetical protein B0H18DRAFT_887962 [Neoantrodia serialis]